MSLFRELSYDGADIATIKSVQFRLLDPEDIKKRSVVHITSTDTYTGNEPVLNGLYDPRMGVTDSSRLCGTCELKSTFCPGHFGHIELAKPVFFYQFMKHVNKILQCVCLRCSKLKYGLDTPEMRAILKKTPRNIARWGHVHKLCSKVLICGQHNEAGCGYRNPDKISRESSIRSFVCDWKQGEERKVLTAEDVFEILKRITDAEVNAMGMSPEFSRPEWMICTVLPVPPPAVRPCVHQETGQRQEDDLSYTLCHIIKNNNTLAQKLKKGEKDEVIAGCILNIQYYVATLVENQIPGVDAPSHKRSGRTLSSIADRLKGKDGRIRGNLMGKRVDFSARSVITPDPNISIDEVGVPLRIAMNLTFPEVVNEYNIKWLTELVINGPEVYPGSKMVRKPREGHRIIRLQNVLDRSSIRLEVGDVVERHLLDGDYIVFNRQPSLHRMSMMGHRVRVMPFNTFRISTSVCSSFNADFDGDEMNAHVPQSYATAIEIEKLASVNTQIISPKNASPIVTIVQDTVLGVWRMTHDHVRIPERVAFNFMAVTNARVPPIIPVDDSRMVTGKQLLSSILPPNISVITDNKQGQRVVIANGEITQGLVDASVYQKGTKGLIHSVYAECGPIITRDVFDNTQKLVCSFLAHTGFSVGLADLKVDDAVHQKLAEIRQHKKQRVYELIDSVHAGTFENKDIMSDGDFLETQINSVLNEADQEAEKAIDQFLKNDARENRMMSMITSGSKGKATNMMQMVGFLGQQNVDSQRISEGFGDRTLPHFTKYDDGPDARGFIQNSFLSGLSPVEFFFHAIGGRSGLIDTAVKSIMFGTEIVIMEAGRPRWTKIGEWIDDRMAKRSDAIRHYPDDRNMEVLELDTEVYIPTGNENGETSWGLVTAVTRHDPGERVYSIKTRGGRTVTVADSESLIVWSSDDMEFKPKHSSVVRQGDFVPTTVNLPDCPRTVTVVNMTDYFPKRTYVYGTDFQQAQRILREMYERHEKADGEWWQEHNGTTFTVPYASAQRIRDVRNAENVREGCLYSLWGPRGRMAHIPDKFELNFDNGVFIGLFLADGNTDTAHASVKISKEDESVLQFVRNWFDKFGITHRKEVANKKRGVSTSLVGSCKLLAEFLDAFVGKGSRNKFVPDVAFTAPIEFARGILNGYFSGDGCIAPNGGIQSSSVSHRLTEGIALLCTRFGIFAKVNTVQQKSNNIGTKDIAPARTLSIRAQFARRFASEINLIYTAKNQQLQETKFAESHANFKEYNDVVLDEIVSIEILPTTEISKLYDVTVPSTLNFTLANGLVIRDTSDIGYLQRKLVKAMEDCKVLDDLTVRNASGQIIQYMYGEDGIDATQLESHKIVYGSWNPLQFAQEYAIPDIAELQDVLDVSKVAKNYKEVCEKHFLQLVADREFLFSKYIPRGVESAASIKIMSPVAYERILTMTSGYKNRENGISDLCPVHVIKKIDALCAELPVPMFSIMCRMYLSPKRIIRHYKLSSQEFDKVYELIRERYRTSYVHAGEMVGVLAAQSIGEPATQLVLNTFHSSGRASGAKVTQGVPRVRELLSATRKIKSPSMSIVPALDIRTDKLKCNELVNKLQVLQFSDVVSRSRIFYDPRDDATVIAEDAEMLKEYEKYSKIDPLGVTENAQNPWLLRIELDRDAIVKRGVTLATLADALVETYEDRVRVVYSDDSSATLVFRIRLEIQDTDDALTELRALESHLLESIVVWGVRDVVNATMREIMLNEYDHETHMMEKKKEWRIYTDGTDLRGVLGRTGIDAKLTVTNDVVEIAQVLGIEAARQALINEMLEVMSASVGIDLNFRHVALLADNMTCRGRITSVDRFGINRGDSSAFSRASFEEVVDMIVNAGVFAELDDMNGVSANVMTGHIAKCGTGYSELAVDIDALQKMAEKLGLDVKEHDEDTSAVDAALLPAQMLAFALPHINTIIPSFSMPKVVVLPSEPDAGRKQNKRDA